MRKLAIAALAAGVALWLPTSVDAQTSPDQIYAELAKLPAAERQKRIEDGARREGKLVLIHTMRGNLSVDHIALFKKRFPFLSVELEGDIGSQDAAERLYAEETAGRHLTDVINIALPDITTLVVRNMVARNPTPAVAALLPPYRGFIDPEEPLDAVVLERARHLLQFAPRAQRQNSDAVDRPVQPVLQGQRLV